MSEAERTSKLKDQGDALFRQRDYASAATKYTKALELGGDNAILYSNRAACMLNLRRFLDAFSDARMATELDPGFAKAHARLATAQDALRAPQRSIDSWQTSLEKLPKENLTALQLNQKAEYEKGLAGAKAELAKLKKYTSILYVPLNSRSPWECADTLIPELDVQGNYTSSAWPLHSASGDFFTAHRLMFSGGSGRLMFRVGFRGGVQTQSYTALTLMSNAVLTEPRIFHITDVQFLEKYNQQVIGELGIFNAWTDEGPEAVKLKVLERLQKEGWDRTRPALESTIRYWIMQGFIPGRLPDGTAAELEYLRSAIEIIKWGREEFKEVNKDIRGVIFEDTFLFSVQSLRLAALMNGMKAGDVAFRKCALEEANEVVGAVDAVTIPPRQDNPAFVQSHYYRPKSEAWALRALYLRLKVEDRKSKQDSSPLPAVIIDACQLAFRCYIQAADCLPNDDEIRVLYLYTALEMMWMCESASVRDQLALMERIRLAIPQMKRIWANSSFMRDSGGGSIFKRTLDMELDLRKAAEKGDFKLDDAVGVVKRKVSIS